MLFPCFEYPRKHHCSRTLLLFELPLVSPRPVLQHFNIGVEDALEHFETFCRIALGKP